MVVRSATGAAVTPAASPETPAVDDAGEDDSEDSEGEVVDGRKRPWNFGQKGVR